MKGLPSTMSMPPGIIARLLLNTTRETIKPPPTTLMSLTRTCFTPPTTPPKLPKLTPKHTGANPKPLRSKGVGAELPSGGRQIDSSLRRAQHRYVYSF